ncbi:hypothetical protein HMPREF0103_0486 [Bacteroides sp. 2_1_33B]|nr:hypothetical protein HMPREF0103_0486 [Bacteroides sp. 2_1_33B]
MPVYVRDGTGTGGKTGASNASNAAPVSHTRTCTLYTSNQTFIRLSGVSHPDRSMPFLRSFSVKFLFYINVRTCVGNRCCITCITCITWGLHKDIDV